VPPALHARLLPYPWRSFGSGKRPWVPLAILVAVCAVGAPWANVALRVATFGNGPE